MSSLRFCEVTTISCNWPASASASLPPAAGVAELRAESAKPTTTTTTTPDTPIARAARAPADNDMLLIAQRFSSSTGGVTGTGTAAPVGFVPVRFQRISSPSAAPISGPEMLQCPSCLTYCWTK